MPTWRSRRAVFARHRQHRDHRRRLRTPGADGTRRPASSASSLTPAARAERMWPLDVAATCAAAGPLSLGCPEPTNLGSEASSRKAGLRPRSRTIRMSPDTPGISSRRAAALHPGSEESAAAAASHDERSSGASARGGDAASATRRGRSVPLRCRRRWRFLCKPQFLRCSRHRCGQGDRGIRLLSGPFAA